MASVSSNIDLKNCVSDFLAHVLVILLQEDKVWKGKKIELPTDLELKMYVQLACFYFQETEKLKFGGIQVLWDYHTKGETTEESNFYTIDRSVTVDMKQVQISHEGTR